MMVGIVVSNGVLLVDYANVLRRRGEHLTTATVHAGRTRLRPILMTTIATIVGLIPMALGIGEGSENQPAARSCSHWRTDGIDGNDAVFDTGSVQLAGHARNARTVR